MEEIAEEIPKPEDLEHTLVPIIRKGEEGENGIGKTAYLGTVNEEGKKHG